MRLVLQNKSGLVSNKPLLRYLFKLIQRDRDRTLGIGETSADRMIMKTIWQISVSTQIEHQHNAYTYPIAEANANGSPVEISAFVAGRTIALA